MEFSRGLRLTDLNDFIAPSQACVIKTESSSYSRDGLLGTKADDKEKLNQQVYDETVKISLHDCLACSGCVTSAEAVLLEQQSVDEFLQQLPRDQAPSTAPHRPVVVSVSPQTRAALAVALSLPPQTVMGKITSFLTSLGVTAVMDTNYGRDVALTEMCREFMDCFKKCDNANNNMDTATGTLAGGDQLNGRTADASGSTTDMNSPPHQGVPHKRKATGSVSATSVAAEDTSVVLPLLVSACPGWVCYAEKSLGEYILPHMSRVKSPQQTMGSIIKRCWGNVYHATVMPCYDKKLEASREDFEFEMELEGQRVRCKEVDCVLTTVELLDLINRKGADLALLPETLPNTPPSHPSGEPRVPEENRERHSDGRRSGPSPHPRDPGDVGAWLRGLNLGSSLPVGSVSGSFADVVFRFAAWQLFGQPVTADKLQYQDVRGNADFREVHLEVGGRKVLSFACVYGFRNLQNLVRRIKAGRCPYHFVEVMACPSGCVNGGGQPKPVDGTVSAKERLQQLQRAYQDEGSNFPLKNIDYVNNLQTQWLVSLSPDSAGRVLHTQYHKREKTVTMQIANW